MIARRQLILLTVVHTTGSKGLSGPDITTSGTLPTLAATEEGKCGNDEVSETHNTDSDDEPDNEALVVVAFTIVDLAGYTTAIVADGVGGVGAGGGTVGVGVGGVSSGRGRGQGGVRGRVGGVGGGPSCDEFLELSGGLIATGDIATCGAFLKSKSDVIGNLIGNLVDFGCVDSKSSRENISGKTEESISDCVYAWERIAEEGDEGNRHTTVVELEVDGTLGEESGLVGKDLVVDELSAVLGDHARDERSVSDKIELWGPRMCVRGVKTARSKETSSD